ncbi:MAG: Sua5/YciO/YrdC/YwlC family protein [Saprospiraceae bacterium]|jgi:L-threonylcarbamoyladenylate synthase|nr:Sua5/YciO/YrdC/YwlC family protein [Saprospiraceae bacterium]MBP9210035.1 Sua5/YciO/YrdC/YwlC family protein [Saprospiraceae bacterium]MBV6472882.1 Threonylcarbamoyl-AMP synthase [Saprospiraceae bacterium]
MIAVFEEEAQISAGLLQKGKILVYPTDTIWGIGCCVRFPESVARISTIKGRDPGKSPILLVDSIAMLHRFVRRIHPRIETLLSHHIRPLTVVYPDPQNLPDDVLAEDGSVALRICFDPFCRRVIQLLDDCLLSTSANFSNQPSPTHFGEIPKTLLEQADYVVHYRQDERESGQASTLIRYNHAGNIEVLRP